MPGSRHRTVATVARCRQLAADDGDMQRPKRAIEQAYSWLMPPSTISSVPTINADSGDDRYSTAPATSSGVPNRFTGICSWMAAAISPSCSAAKPRRPYRGVVTGPGLTTLTRTPCGISSAESVLASEIKAALLAAYTDELGMPMWALIEPFRTMAAPGFNRAARAWIRK